MASNIVRARTLVLLLSIIILVLLLLLLGTGAKGRLVFEKNKELTSSIENLNTKILAIAEKLQQTVIELEFQRSESEKARNKLTQERLKAAQLREEIEELRSEQAVPPAS